MSINVVVSSTAAGVSVSGGTSVSIAVSGGNTAAITVGGGIGPAGFLINPGTATTAFGTFQLTAGDGITISTSAAQFQIASYGTAAVSSLAPVQSVAGRVGAVQLQASDVTAGTFAVARIPTIGYTALSGVPVEFVPASHTHDASAVASGTLSVARIPTISYTALANVPATFAPQAHTHGTADITGFSGTFAAGNHTHDAAAITSGVLELARIPTIGYTALAGVPATFAPAAHTHSTADVVGLTASFSQAGHSHDYVRILNGLTGTVTIAGGAGVTVSTASSSITISAGGGGGGGSANIVEAATSAGFPATGASSTLYVATDVSRVYRWSGSVYVEIGSGGGSAGTLLAAPTGLTASAGNAQVLLQWTPPAGIITTYTVQQSLDGVTWTTMEGVIAEENVASNFVVLTGLTNGTSYRFRLAGVNGAGRGDYSTSSDAVTPALVTRLSLAGTRPSNLASGTTSNGYTLTGTGISASPAVLRIGGGNNNDYRVWLLVNQTGTLNWTVTASSEADYDGGRLYSAGAPANYTAGGFNDATPAGYTAISNWRSGTQTQTGTTSVTSGQHIVLRWTKDSENSELSDRIELSAYIS